MSISLHPFEISKLEKFLKLTENDQSLNLTYDSFDILNNMIQKVEKKNLKDGKYNIISESFGNNIMFVNILIASSFVIKF